MHSLVYMSQIRNANSPIEEGSIPVERIAGVIIKYRDNLLIDVLGVSNSPEHASVIADTMKANDATPGVVYTVKTVKMYPEEAI